MCGMSWLDDKDISDIKSNNFDLRRRLEELICKSSYTGAINDNHGNRLILGSDTKSKYFVQEISDQKIDNLVNNSNEDTQQDIILPFEISKKPNIERFDQKIQTTVTRPQSENTDFIIAKNSLDKFVSNPNPKNQINKENTLNCYSRQNECHIKIRNGSSGTDYAAYQNTKFSKGNFIKQNINNNVRHTEMNELIQNDNLTNFNSNY